ncbi:MAG TPA: GMC family oxidoreductase [Longimicrobium sp.]
MLSLSPHLEFDAVVIGSGFGGAMAAWELVAAGLRVAMVERGGWVERGPHNWAGEGAFVRTPAYAADSAFRVLQGRRWAEQNLCTCVGGPSVYYGGSSFRFREGDFHVAPEIVDGSGAAWPFRYDALEPFYTQAERLLGVAGAAGADPTEPPRSAPYPHAPAPLAEPSRRIDRAARSLGLHPFPIPLAINYAAPGGCQRCTTCDAFACAVGAKNDVATRMVPELVLRGMKLLPETVAVRLVVAGGRVEALECRSRVTGETVVLRAASFVVAAGALATPHLLLASGLERMNPAGHAVGRYLMRHCNAMTYGLFPRNPNPANEHHKQLAIHDFYFGVDEKDAPRGKLGNLQQVMGPPAAMLEVGLPKPLARLGAPVVGHMTGLLSIAEDQPRIENGVRVDPGALDRWGLPRMSVTSLYSPRDLAARAALVRRAKRILRRAGAWGTVTWKVTTFSHVVGTVRMGDDESSAPLDPECRFRGVENLYVTDGSCFPTSAGVNPSLTIAANALRVGRLLAGTPGAVHAEAAR